MTDLITIALRSVILTRLPLWLTNSGYERMEHGTSRSFVVTHPDDIGQVKRVEFYWEYDMDVLQPRSICFFWCNDHLYVSSIGVTEAEDEGNRGYVGAYFISNRHRADSPRPETNVLYGRGWVKCPFDDC